MIRVILPLHLQILAACEREVRLEVEGSVTQRSVLDALEARFPMLRGTIREHATMNRRPKVRFYANGKDVTFDPADAELPPPVASGEVPFIIIGAISGG